AQWQAYHASDEESSVGRYARERGADGLGGRVAALEAYQAGDYAGAERLLRSLIAQRFEIPSTRCHRARIRLIQDRFEDAATEIAAAWEHRAEGPCYVVGRILWLQLALVYISPTEHAAMSSAQVILGRLKTL